MSRIRVQISAQSTDRRTPFKQAQGSVRALGTSWAQALSVRRIDQAAQDAKRTMFGKPTDSAIVARWWIEEHRPATTDVEWEASFERACDLVGTDAGKLRVRLVAAIEEKWRRDAEKQRRAELYVRRAMVLGCAGIPTAIARQYLLPMASEKDYEQVAGVDHGDLFVMTEWPEDVAA